MLKVVFHQDFHQVYDANRTAEAGYRRRAIRSSGWRKIIVRRGVFTVLVLTLLYLSLPASAITKMNDDQKADTENVEVYSPSTKKVQRSELGGTEQRVAISGRTYRQVFEPYLNSPDPIFITSDTVLSAYNVLLRETTIRFEKLNARRLPAVLRLIWSQIPKDETPPSESDSSRKSATPRESRTEAEDEIQYYYEIRKKALRRARFAISVALKLLGDESPDLKDRMQEQVNAEVARITEGKEVIEPEWAASYEEDGVVIDYSRFQPYGSYTHAEPLKRYFRARQWLQTVSFRPENDAELLSILLLGKIFSSQGIEAESDRMALENFFNCYRKFWGNATDRDLLFAARIIRDRPADLMMVREYLRLGTPLEKGNVSGADDPLAEANVADSFEKADAFYIIAPHRRTEAALFEATTTIEGMRRKRPNGLELCAILGSGLAAEYLATGAPEAYRQKLLSTVERQRKLFLPDSLYNQYMNCLAALVDAPEPDAPDFMSDNSWEIKSCNTVLSGWVQRNSLRVSSIETAGTEGGDPLRDPPTGFVEPEPEFFTRLGELVRRTEQIFQNCGALIPPRLILADNLRYFTDMILQQRYPGNESSRFSADEAVIINRSLKALEVLGNIHWSPEDYENQKDVVTIDVLGMAQDIENGIYDDNRSYQALVIDTNLDLGARWRALARICHRLEVMAHKQLRGVSFNKREGYFIADFGLQLASVMRYGGSSYRNPADDAPDIIVMFEDDGRGEYLNGAIARPREFTVLYPYGGQEIFCRGAVMPYHEFVSSRKLSQEQWLNRLDSDERPMIPRWIKPLIGPAH
jgi:hypothetical protein